MLLALPEAKPEELEAIAPWQTLGEQFSILEAELRARILKISEYEANFGRAFWERFEGRERSQYTWHLFSKMRCVARRYFGALGAGVLRSMRSIR